MTDRPRPSHLLLAALAAILLACTASCSGKSEAPAPRNITLITAPLDSLLEPIFDKPSEPGAVVIVSTADSVYYSRGFGLARLDTPAEMSDSTLLNVASATKTFTAMAFMKLVDEGRISLDAPMSSFFPAFNPDVFGRISLRNVLSLSTGLADSRPRNDKEWEDFLSKHRTAFAASADFVRYGREDEQMKIYLGVDSLNYEPGSRFEYSDAPYMLLSKVIELVTDTAFELWMDANIFKPAGLRETRFIAPDLCDVRMANAYAPARGDKKKDVFRSRDGRWDEFDYGEAEYFLTRADNGVYTTPREFVKWTRSLLEGKVVPRQLVDSTYTTLIATGIRDFGYGLGIYTHELPDTPRKVFHSSHNGGFGIYEATFPDIGLSYLIFANRADWNRLELAAKIDGILRAHNWLMPEER
ncbi:MAG: beta-lactamase family protein [Muribaculaceae bacterium]|nr:beta-lactamase family protein [Muribaculaceae bacterium]